MTYSTWAEIKARLNDNVDLENEIFIDADELLALGNEAVNEAEAEIHELYQDYFLATDEITLVSGTEAYSLPADIYANKIRGVVYNDGSDYHRVSRIKQSVDSFLEIEHSTDNDSGTPEEYYLKNESAAAGSQIVFTPSVNVSGAYIKLYYLRNANKFVNDASTCDIPEFVDFIVSYVQVGVMHKEGNPNIEQEKIHLSRKRELMKETLAKMVPDLDDTLELDMSFYQDSYANFEE